jgi:hypothetical protein
VIEAPPLETGAVNATVAVVCPVVVAESIVGAPGAVAAFVSVTEFDDVDEVEVPTVFVALTVNV